MRATSVSLRLPQATINALAHCGGGTTAPPDEHAEPEPSPTPGKHACSEQFRWPPHVYAPEARLPGAIATAEAIAIAAETRPVFHLPPRSGQLNARNSLEASSSTSSALGTMCPPDPPRWSWHLAAGNRPAPGAIEIASDSKPAGGDSTCRTTETTPRSAAFQDDSACRAMEAAPDFSRRWATPRPQVHGRGRCLWP